MKLVYLAHPFLGKPENVEATGFFYFEMSYERGMAHCFEALRRCDELWLCRGWEESRGCKMEVDYARRIGMPIKVIGEDYETETLEDKING